MSIIYWINLLLHVFCEINNTLMGERNVGALLKNIDTAGYLEWLKANFPDLYFQLEIEVFPAVEAVKVESEALRALEEEQDRLITQQQEALGTIKAKSNWLEQEVLGGIFALISGTRRSTYRLLEEGQKRFLLQQANEGQRYLLYIVSAGLGVLNFIALCELLGIRFDRLTSEALIFVPFGLCFSASAMVAINIGLSELIKATRNYTVRGDAPLIKNLFPNGLIKDIPIWISVLFLCADSLFSSIGLMLALPPNLRDDLFWQLAIVAVSGFASLTNIILTWGVTLHRVHISLRFKYEGAAEHHAIEQLEAQIQSVNVSKAQLKKIRQKIKRKRFSLVSC